MEGFTSERGKKTLRPIEEYNYQRNILKTYSCFIVASKLSECVDREALLSGIQKLMASRKQLRLNVFKDDGTNELYLQQISDCSVDDVVEFKTGSDVVQELSMAHGYCFVTGINRPLWKLIVVNSQWLLLQCDHTLLDGNSAAFFHEELVCLLNNQPIGKDCEEESQLSKFTTPSTRYLIGCLLNEFSPKWLSNWFGKQGKIPFKGKHQYQTDDPSWSISDKPPIKDNEFKTLKHLITIETHEFNKLKSLLKAQSVSFTSFWLYLNITVLSQFTQLSLDCSIPVNLRTLLDERNAKSYGLFVSAVELKLSTRLVSHKSIDWDYVRYIQSHLSPDKLKESAQLVGMLNYVKTKDYLLQKSSKPRTCTLEISNLGLREDYKNTAAHPYLKEIIFSQPNNFTGPYITNDMASTSEQVNILIGAVPECGYFYDSYTSGLEALLNELIRDI
ncbi:BA75_02973T0 [Komagataella pastoris]|uniref:BA75_02973T0 n=1 Tax=Komagataella pastoris TaxID=4922 RepID=A0A1B2JA20_PICPA|nr:BA75_02973T0 [Komagataella pastoris]